MVLTVWVCAWNLLHGMTAEWSAGEHLRLRITGNANINLKLKIMILNTLQRHHPSLKNIDTCKTFTTRVHGHTIYSYSSLSIKASTTMIIIIIIIIIINNLLHYTFAVSSRILKFLTVVRLRIHEKYQENINNFNKA